MQGSRGGAGGEFALSHGQQRPLPNTARPLLPQAPARLSRPPAALLPAAAAPRASLACSNHCGAAGQRDALLPSPATGLRRNPVLSAL